MDRGQLLYRDVWEQRPPGIYFVYLWGFRVFGWETSTVAWLDMAAATATTALLWSIGRRLSGALAGAVAAALYAALTVPPWLYGWSGFLERSVCETFIVVAVAAGALAVVNGRDRPWLALAVTAGLFGGAAVILKPNAGLYLPALLGWWLLYRRVADRHAGHRIVPFTAAMVAGSLAAPLLTLTWLLAAGLGSDARVAVIDFNRYYVAEGFEPATYARAFAEAIYLRMKTDPLWLAGSVGAVLALWSLLRARRLEPLAGLAVLWGAAAALVIVVNGARLFNSYFIQTYAPMALLAAWMLTDGTAAGRVRRSIAGVTLALMAVLLVSRGYGPRLARSIQADLGALTGRLDQARYLEGFGGYDNGRGYSARAHAELAAYLRERTRPTDRIFLFGINGAGVYFLADRLTAHRFLRVNFFLATAFPDPAFRLDAVAEELGRRRPVYLIFERLHVGSDMALIRAVDALPSDPRLALLLDGYRFDTRIEDFTLYRLRSPDGLSHDER
jgi:hypothetical protein